MCAYTKIGIIREGKTPPDKRVTLSPQHCVELQEKYPGIDLVVQRSPIRAFTDQEYAEAGIKLVDDLEDREMIIGVKEVPIDMLRPNKAYLFFSHTTKMQPYNKGLLQAICDKGITLLDHELLEDTSGRRVIAFGRFAGIVGAYNGLRAFWKQHANEDLKPAHACVDQAEMQAQLDGLDFPKSLRIIITGSGRVGKGAMEVLDAAGINKLPWGEFSGGQNDGAVYTVLDTEDMYVHQERGDFNKSEFYANPEVYRSLLAEKMKHAGMYIACHYWNPNGPMLLTQEDLVTLPELLTIADISCDITEPIASTVRPSTIANPFYGYLPTTGKEVDFGTPGSVGIMAVDNLPCELPRDSSMAFGQQFMAHVASCMMETDPNGMLERATIVKNGEPTNQFSYLKDWLNED